MPDHPTNQSPFRSIEDAQRFLEHSADHEKKPDVAYDRRNFNLARTRAVLRELGNPQRRLRVIHMAGTKGKGTTCTVLERCLREAGYRTGLYTSPHLQTIRERMRTDGEPISEEDFCALVEEVRPYVEEKREGPDRESPTYFEILTALALRHFADRGADWAVVEVGLGGRLDSTNVLRPQCCVITSIGYDHTDKLGDTIEEIAGEKAAIIKDGIPVILGAQHHGEATGVLRLNAAIHHSPCWEVGPDVRITRSDPLAAPPDAPDDPVGWRFSVQTPGRSYLNLVTPLLGAHQVENCAAALGALEMLRAEDELEAEPESIARAIADCVCPARVEVLGRSPALVLDAAHTVESIEALLSALETHFPDRRLILVFGCSADKNYEGMMELLGRRADRIFTTRADSLRAADPAVLAELARGSGPPSTTVVPAARAVRAALARAGSSDLVCATGSFYVAGEVRTAWQQGELG